MPPFTNAQKYAVVVREVEMRRRVYPGWVAKGRMKQEEADFQIAVMDEIGADYKRLATQDPAGPLFGR